MGVAPATDLGTGEVLTKLGTGQSQVAIDAGTLEALREYRPDTELEKKLVRKADLLLIPTLWVMCVLCFMDRSNIVSISHDDNSFTTR